MKKQRYVGVIVKCKNKVLLCKRNKLGSYPGMWSIPAGKLENNESTKEGAKREFFEETNIEVDLNDLVFTGIVPRYTRDGKKVKGMMYVYLLNSDVELNPDLENAVDGDEHSDCGYFTFKEIKLENIGEFLYKMMDIVLNKKKFN